MPPQKVKCSVCRKKITFTYIQCKCGLILCLKHRYADEHDCTYDHKAAWKEQLKKNNPTVKKRKVDEI